MSYEVHICTYICEQNENTKDTSYEPLLQSTPSSPPVQIDNSSNTITNLHLQSTGQPRKTHAAAVDPHLLPRSSDATAPLLLFLLLQLGSTLQRNRLAGDAASSHCSYFINPPTPPPPPSSSSSSARIRTHAKGPRIKNTGVNTLLIILHVYFI